MAIKQSTLAPSAVELITANALQITAAYLGGSLPLVKEPVKAHLLIEFQEATETALDRSMELVAGIIEEFTTEEILTASTAAEKERLWKLRINIGHAMTAGNRYYRDIDIAVPLSLLYEYITTVEKISEQHQVKVACFGHALDGNLHTMLLADTADPTHEENNFRKAAYEIYSYALARGGVISGEHGIGLLQREFMPLQFSAAHLTLMRSIKHCFDPNGILNPGKIF
jgi:glycolate oxidase